MNKNNKIIVGIDEAGRGCERPDAEVLTNNGWKSYFEISLKDKVLSYADNGYMKWQKIDKIIENDFNGNLIELKNRGIDIVVTHDHYFTILRRVFKRDKKDNNRLKMIGYKTREERRAISELTDNDFIPRGGKWRGINKCFFKLPKVDKNEEKVIDIQLWVAFMGIFLSEGSVSYEKKKGAYKIYISQNISSPKDKYIKIQKLLKDLPFKFSGFKDGFRCLNKQLYVYLKQFGNCYNKFIPKNIKGLSPELLNIFISWIILGDGSSYVGENRKEVYMYYTVSNKLKDDFEEVLLKAGWTYHTNIREPKDRWIGKRLIKKENQAPCFETRLRRNNKAVVKHLHKKEIFYKGKVFCLQLSKYNNFYVRRDGTGYFTGNSLGGPVVASAVCFTSVSPNRFKTNGITITDSKKMSPRQREEVFEFLKIHPKVEWGIGRVSEKIIDKINILEATKLAMQRAVFNLEKKLQKPADFLLIDGNFSITSNTPQQSIIRGDEKVFLISMASIIAKVHRDRGMRRYHKQYPEYGFATHKGYGTKAHYAMIAKHGPCKIHRKTFRGVGEC